MGDGDFLKELDAMDEMLGEPIPPKKEDEEEEQEEPKEEESKEEPKEEESPKEDEEESEEEEEEEPDESAKIKQENEDLKKQLEELRKKPPEEKKIEPPPPPPELKDEEFVKDEDLDEVSRDPKKLNLVLNQVYKKAIEFARNEIRSGNESVVRSMPDIVKNNIAIVTSLKKASEKFYEDNKDLQPFKKVVAVVYEELQSQNPDKKYDELLRMVGDETRKRLDLQKKATDKTKKNDPPPLPHKKGGRIPAKPTKADTNPLLNELDAMDKSLNL